MPHSEINHTLSKILVGFYTAVFLLVFVFIATATIAMIVRVLAMSLWWFGLLSAVRQILVLHSLQKICVKGGVLEFILNGQTRAVEVLGRPLVNPYLIAFRCRSLAAPRAFYSVLLLPDSVDAESHRLLRIYFLHGK